MLSELPEPRHRHLPQAPVELVVWQLQFAEPAQVLSPEVGTGLASRLDEAGHGSFQLDRHRSQTFAFAFGAGQVPQPAPAEALQVDGWRLTRGTLVVTVGQHALSVETTEYPGWAAFRVVVEEVLSTLARLVALPGQQRLGLRYVDRISRPGVHQPSDWGGQLASWLVGPLAHQHLRDAVLAHGQQIDFAPDTSGVQATMRHNTFPDAERRGRSTVMLDYDTFRMGYRIVEPVWVMEASDRMHDLAHRLFEASITDDLYAFFAGQEGEQG